MTTPETPWNHETIMLNARDQLRAAIETLDL